MICVLVDIFAREKEKEEIKVKPIKDSQEYFPETHTVVLYKNPPVNGKHEIMVIDPNNFTFSTHLAGEDIKFQHEAFDKVTTIYKTTQIYKPDNNNIGLGNNQYRDCTDIAVKIAFGLNGKKNWEKIAFDKIGANNIIKAISNNPDIDKAIISKDHIARIKQASDIKIIHKFNAISDIINNSISKAFVLKFNDCRDKAKSNYKNIIDGKNNNYEDILSDLLTLNQDISTQLFSGLAKQLYQEKIELQGILNNIDEIYT